MSYCTWRTQVVRRGNRDVEARRDDAGGNFLADTGEISINVHRHICGKNIRLLGLTNHPSTGYGPALRLLERYADRYPFEEMVTHEFGLDDVETAMRTSMSPQSMKAAGYRAPPRRLTPRHVPAERQGRARSGHGPASVARLLGILSHLRLGGA